MKTLAVILISAFSLFAQTDWQKWGKADFHYSKQPGQLKHTFTAGTDSVQGPQKVKFPEILLKGAVKVYWVTISDVDGDNCPFTPTCSGFFLQSVKETNVFQGTLMFFDRFTRDTNTFERPEHYPVIKNDRMYDPVTLYTLNENKTRKALRDLYQQSGK